MHYQIGRSLGWYLENYDPTDPRQVADCYFRALWTWKMILELPAIHYAAPDLRKIIRESNAKVPTKTAQAAIELILAKQNDQLQTAS